MQAWLFEGVYFAYVPSTILNFCLNYSPSGEFQFLVTTCRGSTRSHPEHGR